MTNLSDNDLDLILAYVKRQGEKTAIAIEEIKDGTLVERLFNYASQHCVHHYKETDLKGQKREDAAWEFFVGVNAALYLTNNIMARQFENYAFPRLSDEGYAGVKKAAKLADKMEANKNRRSNQ